MKKFFLLLIIAFLAQGISAQPKLRRAEAKKAQKKSNAENVTLRSQISFPVEMKMNEDVVWRRDVYRKLDLTKEANAGLYYPVEPVDGKMNLFTYIFKLFLRGAIPAYEYRLDGNESFNEKSRVTPKSIIDNYHIYYEKTDKGIHIDESDIPLRRPRTQVGNSNSKSQATQECVLYLGNHMKLVWPVERAHKGSTEELKAHVNEMSYHFISFHIISYHYPQKSYQ